MYSRRRNSNGATRATPSIIAVPRRISLAGALRLLRDWTTRMTGIEVATHDDNRRLRNPTRSPRNGQGQPHNGANLDRRTNSMKRQRAGRYRLVRMRVVVVRKKNPLG